MGKELQPEITKILEHYDNMIRITKRTERVLSSKLNVGYLYNAYRRFIPNVANKFSNRHSDVSLHLYSYEYLDSINELLKDDIDLALSIDVDNRLYASCNIETLGIDRLYCVVRQDDPLAARDTISLSDLQGEPLILPSQETSGPYACFIEKTLDRANVRPCTTIYYREIDTRYLAIEAGDGVGLVGGHFRPYMNDNLKFISIDEDYCRYDLVAVWKKTNTNPNIAPFVELLKAEYNYYSASR